jgi:hypothetical protein
MPRSVIRPNLVHSQLHCVSDCFVCVVFQGFICVVFQVARVTLCLQRYTVFATGEMHSILVLALKRCVLEVARGHLPRGTPRDRSLCETLQSKALRERTKADTVRGQKQERAIRKVRSHTCAIVHILPHICTGLCVVCVILTMQARANHAFDKPHSASTMHSISPHSAPTVHV